MKLWGGRFTKSTDSFTDHFHSSISFDQRMYKEDITGSIAHAAMLGKQGVISEEDSALLQKTLKGLLEDIENGKVEFDEKAEDIHMNIETLLIERIGDVGKRLHTGRSRNDQVALDIRMYNKEQIADIKKLLVNLIKTLNKIAEDNIDTIMPGYTHLQRAQPVTLAHHLLAYCEMFKRDIARLDDTYKRTNVMPLGSGALAGTTYPLDRQYVCDQLGFDSITLDSMDGVSDRDFCVELLSCLSMVMMHLSRFCEEIILWSSHEFKFVELDDAFSTGSSIMPQKKNPDVCELIRGKTGRVYGDLMTLLTMLKGIPLAYNKDLQEDKEAVFDAIDTAKQCLKVLTPMFSTMEILKDNMKKAALKGFINATDCADYLTKKGMPFRDAYRTVGQLVAQCVKEDKSLADLTLEEYKEYSEHFDADIYRAIDLGTCVAGRCVTGGPAPSEVERQIGVIRRFLEQRK